MDVELAYFDVRHWDRVASACGIATSSASHEVLASLADAGGDLEGKHVLDVGAGNGVLALAFAARGARVTGIDPSPRSVEIAAEHARAVAPAELLPRVRFDCMGAEALAYDDGSFDVVTLLKTLWVLRDVGACLRELHRVLAPGGRILAQAWGDPGRCALITSGGRALLRFVPEARVPAGASGPFDFTAERLESELRAAGFDGIEIARHARVVEIPSVEAFWQACSSTASTAYTLYMAQPEHERRAIDAAWIASVLPFRLPSGEYRLPLEWIVARALKPTSGDVAIEAPAPPPRQVASMSEPPRDVREGKVPQIGVGLQYNPEILGWFPFEEQRVDALEVLLDTLMAPLDGPGWMLPGKAELIERLKAKATLIAHSNYGGDFGFEPLEESAAARRHVRLARALESPWASNHCFYADGSWVDVWSSPLQLSKAEIARLAPRARALQALYGVPLAHENAAYYLPCPGGDLPEPEFLAGLVDAAGTYLHLDLHNVYTNSVNHRAAGIEAYLSTLPLDRIIEIHLAGGSWAEGFYHDWHDSKVPEPVWEMLERVLAVSRPGAVILEFQGRAHHPSTRVLRRGEDLEMIQADLERAARIWDRAYGPGSRRTTRGAGDGR